MKIRTGIENIKINSVEAATLLVFNSVPNITISRNDVKVKKIDMFGSRKRSNE